MSTEKLETVIFDINRGFFSNFHSGIEFSYALTKTQSAVINGKLISYQPNEICFCNPYDIHTFLPSDNGTHYLFSINEIDFAQFQDITPSIMNHLTDIEVNKEILSILDYLHEHQNELTPMELNGYRTIILGKIIKHYKNENKIKIDKTYHDIRDVLFYLNDHYMKPLTRDSVASHFGYTPNYFSYLFKSTLNIGFKEYLNQLRYLKVMDKLSSQKISKTNAILESGFENTQSFYRIQRKKSPR